MKKSEKRCTVHHSFLQNYLFLNNDKNNALKISNNMFLTCIGKEKVKTEGMLSFFSTFVQIFDSQFNTTFNERFS
jgi:hypothetical protein